MPRRCPSDCVFPELFRSRWRSSDLWRILLLQSPYRCESCGRRFFKTSQPLAFGLCLVILAVAYPLSYRYTRGYESNPTVKAIYQPLHWVEEAMFSLGNVSQQHTDS
ncbi:MAG: hypothetical protein KDA58_10920 [Planctomycetaceae bacterium]|nr:hypothetical protein [Planctomycetaceae bacterium]